MEAGEVQVLESSYYFRELRRSAAMPSDFLRFYKDASFVDANLCVEVKGRRIIVKAHRVVLAACSDFFWRKFKRNPLSSDAIVLQSISEKCLRQILDLIYGETVVARSEEEFEEISMALRGFQIRIGFSSSLVNEEIYSGLKMPVAVKSETLEPVSSSSLEESFRSDETPQVDVGHGGLPIVERPTLGKRPVATTSATFSSPPMQPMEKRVRPMQLMKQECYNDIPEPLQPLRPSQSLPNPQPSLAAPTERRQRPQQSRDREYTPLRDFSLPKVSGSVDADDLGDDDGNKAAPISDRNLVKIKPVAPPPLPRPLPMISAVDGLLWMRFDNDSNLTEEKIRQYMAQFKIVKVDAARGYLGVGSRQDLNRILNWNAALPAGSKLTNLVPSDDLPSNFYVPKCNWWLVMTVGDTSSFTPSIMTNNMLKNKMVVSKNVEPIIKHSSGQIEVPFDSKPAAERAEKRYKDQTLHRIKITDIYVEARPWM